MNTTPNPLLENQGGGRKMHNRILMNWPEVHKSVVNRSEVNWPEVNQSEVHQSVSIATKCPPLFKGRCRIAAEGLKKNHV